MSHGVHDASTGIAAARWSSQGGLFGRMFRSLPPFEPPRHTQAKRERWLLERAARMFAAPGDAEPVNHGVPAAYTYLGQFVAHDLSFDLRGIGERAADPDRARSYRSPRLDLDHVYGGGPQLQPYLYERDPAAPDEPRWLFRLAARGGHAGGLDVPRLGDAPVVADPRNTSHYITTQLHVAVMRFHNRATQELVERGVTGANVFVRAQQLTRWHYQWVVVDDYLRRLTPWSECVQPHLGGPRPDSLFSWREMPFVPLEFSAAAFRFGHAMIRSDYRLDRGDAVPFDRLVQQDHANLPEIAWRYLVGPDRGRAADTHYSRKLGATLAPALAQLPRAFLSHAGDVASLAARDLLRGWHLGLPSGQAVARLLGRRAGHTREDPLWIYVLEEANRDGEYGTRLGPVGARIVADVLMGLLWGDPTSFLRAEPGFEPTLGRRGGARYRMAQFLEFAGMTMDDAAVAQHAEVRGGSRRGPGGREVGAVGSS